jgi:chemotaxis signal transduction protein
VTADAGDTLRCLLVQAGQHLCALPLGQLRRVERALVAHPLPGGAPALLGLAEFAGEPLPLVELAQLIDAPPGATPACPVTVIAWAGPPASRECVGLAVDAALHIVELADEAVAGRSFGVVRGEASIAGRLVRVLDLSQLGVDAA